MDSILDRFSVMSLSDPDKTYTIDISKNTCSCPHWKYQRKPVHLRTCKHLDKYRTLENESSDDKVRYTNKRRDDYFLLIADYPPSSIVGQTLLYSEKYDGIRISLKGHLGTTRGGIEIDLKELKLPFVQSNLEFDCELVMSTGTKTSHNSVMIEVNSNRIHNLTVKVFDLIDYERTFQERLDTLNETVGDPYLVKYRMVTDWETLRDSLLSIQSEGGEGLVVRNVNGMYIRGRRSTKNAFKIKRMKILNEKVK